MPRSRNGCTTCKRRHRKCDETKPACLQCQNHNLECDGYAIKLQWDVGVASRGRLTGSSLPVLLDGGIQSESKEQEIETDNFATSFRQLQTTQLVAATEESVDYLSDYQNSPLDMESYSVNNTESDWFQLKSLEEQELLERSTYLYISSPRNPPPLFHELCDQSLRLFREQLSGYNGTLDSGLINAGTFLCTLHVGRDTPTLSIWGYLRAGQAATPEGLVGGVESISGIPRSLLDIIARIGIPTAEEEFAAWPGHEGSVPHCHLWEAFRLAGILLSRRQNHISNSSPTNEVLVCRLVATLDALYETRHREEYRHILATNSILYPYTAARLEVSILRQRPSWLKALRKYAELCDAYRDTPNALILEEILDNAMDRGDNDVDLDKQAQQRGVELSLF
ncbi:unnamed protein product [Fusarium venenatum]|uniref:Zn(2)-C6 fungal-type domain-containing protein n=1 Tax=Fusarium venenatum TaxID=56646 RepID=A0A2L2TZC7_9HYPO|nr:uncharacterized protein FVRRES_04252 [Fusarium venenatum]CEI67740.1 unnamed protein product [Fusarium venenatum]